ncbi:ABC transporter permease [Halomonas ventosae]|jgi:putative spermidine/putrescine transport system permease protein|uniref:Putative spermidine/putrescine transport system permease protein n=1 Tax=Halomonas ventosae TaxID=229007 RepID=A0A4R6GQJ7_9GAMM|nr:hypothetical protein [Halomonas ventosae]TDN97592.1 putative spermidine/putrescine transport system permease protein [Halomonas ventosae]
MRSFIITTSLLIAAFVILAFFYPLVVLTGNSLTGQDGGFGFDAYAQVLSSSYFMASLRDTLIFCAVTSVVATAWALPLAWRIGRGLPGAGALRISSQINFAFAGIVYGMLVIALMGNAGALVLIERALFGTSTTAGLAFTLAGLAITYLSFQIPRSALILAEAIEKLDPALVPAARTLGAQGSQAAFLVTLPLLRPVIVEAASFSFILAMGSFGPALLLARSIPIYPAVIYREFTGFLNFSTAAAMAVILALIVLGLTTAVRLAIRPATP